AAEADHLPLAWEDARHVLPVEPELRQVAGISLVLVVATSVRGGDQHVDAVLGHQLAHPAPAAVALGDGEAGEGALAGGGLCRAHRSTSHIGAFQAAVEPTARPAMPRTRLPINMGST